MSPTDEHLIKTKEDFEVLRNCAPPADFMDCRMITRARQAVGDKAGIRRYGHFTLPMEEALVTAAIDLSGRHYLVFKASFPAPKIGGFDSELIEDFWQAVAANALCNLHILLHHGRNSHHISEAIFKSVARSLRAAVEVDPSIKGVPSTKGTLGE